MPPSVQILQSSEIDRNKWDSCIVTSANGLIYSQSVYLDHMCDNWAGLIIGDYEAVMALPWRRKLGIRYIYQPAFIQQTGIIGKYNGPAEPVLSAVSLLSNYGDLFFNFNNDTLAGQLQCDKKTNLVINLAESYDQITARYKKDLLNNLKKAGKEPLNVLRDFDVEEAITLYRAGYNNRLNLPSKDYSNLISLCKQLEKRKMCFIRTIVDESNTLLSVGLFLQDEKRIYNLANTTTAAGRAKEANHFLLDAVLKEFSGKDLFFDFEGSDLPGVKNFYEKFGAEDQPYYHYHFNLLPAFIRLFKR